jgi:putative SOS response-associated peptidase YedK
MRRQTIFTASQPTKKPSAGLFRKANRYIGNLAPMPGVFPDYPAPIIRYAGDEREMVLMRWGMPPPPKFGGPPVTNMRNTSSPHLRSWMKLEILVRASLLMPSRHLSD